LTARRVRNEQGGQALQVSVRTVQRILQRYGRIAMRPLASPSLNTQRKRRRFQWAMRAFSAKVMIWGCFSRRGLGCYCAIEGTMNIAQYPVKNIF
jgi:hypothetical protein